MLLPDFALQSSASCNDRPNYFHTSGTTFEARALGALELKRGNVAAAKRHFDLAIAVNDSASVRVNVTARYSDAGRITDAVAHLEALAKAGK